jgi:hypothetical protein
VHNPHRAFPLYPAFLLLSPQNCHIISRDISSLLSKRNMQVIQGCIAPWITCFCAIWRSRRRMKVDYLCHPTYGSPPGGFLAVVPARRLFASRCKPSEMAQQFPSCPPPNSFHIVFEPVVAAAENSNVISFFIHRQEPWCYALDACSTQQYVAEEQIRGACFPSPYP